MRRDEERRQKLIDAMQEAHLELLICPTPLQVRMVSGYWPVMGASVAAVRADGTVYVLLPEDEVELAQATSDSVLIHYRPVTLERLSSPAEVLRAHFHRLARKVGGVKGLVGMPSVHEVEPSPYLAHNPMREMVLRLVQEEWLGVEVKAAHEMLEKLQSVKTPDEVVVLRHACELAAHGFQAAPAAINAGRREDEVAAEVQAAYSKVANQGFERGFGTFFCMSGPNSTKAAGAFARTRTRVLEQGDLVMIHANTTGDGIWTDLTRTYSVGEPTAEHRRMRGAIDEARAAAMHAVTPGVFASRVDEAARSVLTRHGFGKAFKHAVGHGVGFAAANPNALPRLHPQSPDVLAAGMTFNLEPAIYIDGVGGLRHCDVVACTRNGPDVLSRF